MVSVILERFRATRVACLLVLLCAVHPASAAWAGPAVLTLDLTRVGGGVSELSLEQLQAMPQTTVVTENEFVDGEVSYRGPLVRELLGQLDPGDATSLKMTAANDFAVDVPISDVMRYDVILALQADERMFSRRGKGPIWLMYPISDNPELKGDPVINTRLIWQLIRMEVN